MDPQNPPQTDSDLISGSSRMRVPVSANIAFAIAGATGGTPGSPTPPGAAVLSTRSRVVRRGASLMRTMRPPPRKLSCWMAPRFMVMPPYMARLMPKITAPSSCARTRLAGPAGDRPPAVLEAVGRRDAHTGTSLAHDRERFLIGDVAGAPPR